MILTKTNKTCKEPWGSNDFININSLHITLVITASISSMLLHKQSMNSLPYLTYFSSSQASVHFGLNVNLFYCLQRHTLSFSILWHPTYAVSTYGSDKLCKSYRKETELVSIIERICNMQFQI